MFHQSFRIPRIVILRIGALALLCSLCALTAQLTTPLATSYAAPQKASKEQEKAAKAEEKAAKEAAKEKEKAEKESSKSSSKSSSSSSSKSTSSSSSKSSKGGKSKLPTNAPTTEGTPAIWRDLGDVAQLNLFWGIGSEAEQPKPPFQFDKEDITGTNPKIKIIDANGVKWNMKFDEEVHAEVVSSRLVWAMGYMVEESYFVTSGTVNGVTGLGRAKKFIGTGGSFTNAMFEKRPDNIARRRNPWAWDGNPFANSKELAGLGVLCFLLSNWDAKESNNNVLGMFDEDGKTVKEWFLVADWGGTFGKTGGFMSHSKWDAVDYGKQAFIDGVSGGTIKFHYTGKMGSSLKAMPVANAKWITERLAALSDAQWRDAFKAGGATQAETDAFLSVLRRRMGELKQATGM